MRERSTGSRRGSSFATTQAVPIACVALRGPRGSIGFKAIELCADHSPLGEVPVGEIVVVDERHRRVFTGVYATRLVRLRLPLLFLYGLLLYVSPIRKLAGGSKPGRNGDVLEV